MFSAYHLRPEQMVSTFPFGLALAFLALRADSIIPSTLAHVMNNATVILLQRDEVPALDRVLGEHPERARSPARSWSSASGLALAGEGTA